MSIASNEYDYDLKKIKDKTHLNYINTQLIIYLDLDIYVLTVLNFVYTYFNFNYVFIASG